MNIGNIDFENAIRFSAEEMGAYAGCTVRDVAFYPMSEQTYWKINRYTVTLITGEGVTGTLSANEAAYNETVTVIALSGNGYNPPVITAVPRENAELVSEGVYRITGPVSFVAVAETKTIYTASFYLDGGLYYTQSAIEGSLTTVALPNPPEKHGYSFTGWYTEQTGGAANGR